MSVLDAVGAQRTSSRLPGAVTKGFPEDEGLAENWGERRRSLVLRREFHISTYAGDVPCSEKGVCKGNLALTSVKILPFTTCFQDLNL